MNEILVGIDFGTTNTVISYFDNNKVNLLTDGIFKTIPSKIVKLDRVYCGNYIPINSPNVIHSFKLSIGEVDYDNELLLLFFYHLTELITKAFRHITEIKAVITVPSNFNDKQREIIKNSFELVNIKVLRIINEPSAAALAYGLNHSSQDEEKILVCDIGGGTSDFTLLEKIDNFFQVIHSHGLNDLGGNNFTKLIVNDIIRTYSLSENNIIWNQAQKIKEKLTYLDNYQVKFKYEDRDIDYYLTRAKFENMSNQLISKLEETLKTIINNYNDIDYVILVGGTSRIPLIQKTIENIINKKIWIHPKVETVVAEGAGLYAGILENKYNLNEDVILMDVVPLSLGVELADQTYSIIIPKNTPLPVKRSHKYTTDTPADSSIKIKIYQGERKIANKNFLIGEFIFDKLSVGGVPIIEIIFKIDVNSIINVIVIDRKSGCEKSIIIKDLPQYKQEDITRIIEDSCKLSEIDNSELNKIQNIYLIKSHIENIIINLTLNELIDTENKNKTLKELEDIENRLEAMNNLQLIDVLKDLETNYILLGSKANLDQSDDKLDDIEKIFLNEKKTELLNRINLLLAKNPDWDEYLTPVLEELSYNNTTFDYITDKLKLIEELEDKKTDYQKETKYLCLYLKAEIECGNINLGNNNQLLIELINEKLNLPDDSNWEEELNNLNKKCEEIYYLK